MTPSDGMPKATVAAEPRPRPLLAALAETARRFLGKDERRVLGGLSHGRTPASRPAETAVPLSTFKMVGLAEVQAKLADRWPALSEKVHLIARNTISKHMMRGDVFERHGDDGYLVLFASLGAAEAEFKSRVIAKEIAEHLLGEGGAASIGLSTHCTTISPDMLATGDLESVLADVLARAPQLEANDAVLARYRADGDQGARAFLPPGSVDDLGAQQTRRRSTPPEPVEEPVKAHAQAYSPVWDVTQMTLLRFRAPIVETFAGAETEHAAESEASQADLRRIRAVNDDLRDLVDHGRRLPIIVPVHHTSLGSVSQRTRLYDAFAEAPMALRKLITVEICFPREEFWTYACKAFIEMARPLGLGWSALTDLEQPLAIPKADSILRGVATTLSSEMRSEAESLRLMTIFCQRCRALDLACAAHGLATRALVLGAVGAGFRFLSGRAVHADVSSLANAVRFEPLDLYPDLVQRDPLARPAH
jgi:hypothetical protein